MYIGGVAVFAAPFFVFSLYYNYYVGISLILIL